MAWHYVVNNEQQGPVDQPEWERLFRQGVVTDSTLVWREGMTDWQPYSEVAGSQLPAPAAPGTTAGVACSECGKTFPPEEVIRLAGRTVCAQCKPRATQKMLEGVSNAGDAEHIRQEHIRHEASVKSIGFLYLIGAVFMIVIGLGNLAGASMPAPSSRRGLFLGSVLLAFAALQIAMGLGLRRLKPWTRTAAGVFSALGLLAIPLGTIINAYILYLLFSQKGKVVFSEAYQQVIAQTPQVRYRTSLVLWIALILLLLLLVIAVVFGVSEATR